MDAKRLAKIVDRAMRCEGQTTRAELTVLARLAATVPADQVIVEIGSYQGRSTVALALGSLAGNRVRVYAIDPHTVFVGVKGGHFGPRDMSLFYANLVRVDIGEVVAAVCLPAADVAVGWEDTVGLWFHDGDHRYAPVHVELRRWFPHLAQNGILAFHDSSSPGIRRILEELGGLECYSSLEIAGTEREITWFRKRG